MESHKRILIARLTELSAQLDTLRQWLEGQTDPEPLQQQETPEADLDRTWAEMLQRRQRERLQGFALQTNDLVAIQGSPELGGLLQVNARSVKLSPTEWPFVLILAEAMQQHRAISSPQRGLGFVTKEALAERAQELTRGLRTTFRPAPETVKIYLSRIRKKLAKHGLDPRLIETQRRLGWRLSTLPEHIEIVGERA
jgi:hypothetical protein